MRSLHIMRCVGAVSDSFSGRESLIARPREKGEKEGNITQQQQQQ